MDDTERLEDIVKRVRTQLGGIDEGTYRRWLNVLETHQAEHGYDPEGRLKVAVFSLDAGV